MRPPKERPQVHIHRLKMKNLYNSNFAYKGIARTDLDEGKRWVAAGKAWDDVTHDLMPSWGAWNSDGL